MPWVSLTPLQSSGEGWQGTGSRNLRSHAVPGGSSRLARSQITLPSLSQRLRILQLIGTLSPHHTKECTRQPQSLYADQVHDRYAPLIGHKKSWASSGSFLARILGGGKDATQLAVGTHNQKIRRDLAAQQHKYFFAINLYNSFDVIPDIFATLFRVAAVLGYHNVFVSIYENGSSDQTKSMLKIFDALARSVGLRIIIRTSMRTRGQFNHRIEYLAEVRNAAMVPLHELRDNQNEVFDSIIFMNDVLPCVDDLLELIWQSRKQNAGITCASDYMYHDDIVSQLSRLGCGKADMLRALRCSMTIGLLETSTGQRWRMHPSSRSSTTPNQTIASSATCQYKVGCRHSPGWAS